MEILSTLQALTYPNGWFAVGYSTDIKPGQILKRRYFGRELVLFRTTSGQVALIDAYCPHLGAHFAHGGKIIEESIQCPFHGFCFDAGGVCVSKPSGSALSSNIRMNSWRIVERYGFIFAYFDADLDYLNAPRWELPKIDDAAYTQIKGYCQTVQSHPQEILENSVDFAHLTALHAFHFPAIEPQITEHHEIFRVSAEIERMGDLFSRKRVRVVYTAFMHGLGVSYVDLQVPEQQFQLRLFGMATPVDQGILELRLAVQLHKAVQPGKIHFLLNLLPKPWVNALILRQALNAYMSDTSKDITIWQNKIYIPSPAPDKGNGAILRYRRWAKQFY